MRKNINITLSNLPLYELLKNKSEAINFLLEKAKNDEEFLKKFLHPQSIQMLKKIGVILNADKNQENLKTTPPEKQTEKDEKSEKPKVKLGW